MQESENTIVNNITEEFPSTANILDTVGKNY